MSEVYDLLWINFFSYENDNKIVNVYTSNGVKLLSFILNDNNVCTDIDFHGRSIIERDAQEKLKHMFVELEVIPSLRLEVESGYYKGTDYYPEIARSELTRTCDKFFIGGIEISSFYYTYMCPFDNKTWSLRVPGRTVGNVNIDRSGHITGIIVDKNYYNIDQNELNKFIGVKIRRSM